MLSKILIKQMVDALVAKAEEGRGRLRKMLGSCQQTMIQRCPNEITPLIEILRILDASQGREFGELKHLSTRKKRNRKRFR